MMTLVALFLERLLRQAAGVPAPPTSTASGLAARIFSTCPVTEVSARLKRSLPTIWILRASAIFENSFHQPSP
jgi:hypothetical protein